MILGGAMFLLFRYAILIQIPVLLAQLSFCQAECRFETAATILEERENHLLQYWEFHTAAIPNSFELPQSPSFSSYREAVTAKINSDPLGLLERYLSAGPYPADAHNIEIVLSDPRRIRPIQCVEALLLDYQIGRTLKMLTEPTEFLSLFLVSPEGRYRAYYLTDDVGGIRRMEQLKAYVGSDLELGWLLVGNLHNHSFSLDHLDWDQKHHPQGVLAPSASDIQVFRGMKEELNLRSASITNGFHTISIPAEDFGKYRAPSQTCRVKLEQVRAADSP
jgi:hypothetical protein